MHRIVIPTTPLVVVSVLALLIGPAYVMSRRAFWRAIVELHPAAFATLFFAIVVPVIALPLALFRPELAAWLSWTTLVGVAVCLFLGRSGRGSRSGWPAGSLGWWGSVLSLIDPGEYARRATRHGDVFKIRQMHRPTVCLVDLQQGTGLLREHHELLGPATLPFNDAVPGGFVRFLRGDDHRARRSALQVAFSRRAVGEMEPSLRASVRAGVRVLADADPWHPREIEWPILHAMIVAFLGPVASGVVHRPTADLVQSLTTGDEDDLRALMDDLTSEAAAPSVMSSLLERLDDNDPSDREMILANAAYILNLGWRDLSGFAAWIVAECARRPELLGRVKTEPELSRHIVEETLRLRQSEYLYRKAMDDIPVGNRVIPRGWLVRVCVREAHRSAEHFRDPEEFDAMRFDAACPYGTPSTGRFQPFGVDHHGCLGADLTRAVGRILVEELASYELRVCRDAAPATGGRHWRHVAPGRRMRVSIRTPRT